MLRPAGGVGVAKMDSALVAGVEAGDAVGHQQEGVWFAALHTIAVS